MISSSKPQPMKAIIPVATPAIAEQIPATIAAVTPATTTTATMTTTPTTASLRNTPLNHPRHSLNILNQKSRAMAICGPPAIGTGLPMAIIGFPARGPYHPKPAIFGPRDIGDIAATATVITTAITAVLIMEMVTPGPVIRADTGGEIASTTTVPSTASARITSRPTTAP